MIDGWLFWAAGGGFKRRYQHCSDNSGKIIYLLALQRHSGDRIIDLALQDNVLIRPGVFPTFAMWEAHSILTPLSAMNWYLEVKIWAEDSVLLNCWSKKWKSQRPRTNWLLCTTSGAIHAQRMEERIEEGLVFYQTRTNAITLQGTLPAHCIAKVERLKTGEKLYERQSLSPRPPPKNFLHCVRASFHRFPLSIFNGFREFRWLGRTNLKFFSK